MIHEQGAHTIETVGETVERHYREFRAFAAKAETKTDEGLKWWRRSHWSALIGLGLLILAMVVGDHFLIWLLIAPLSWLLMARPVGCVGSNDGT